RTSGPGPGRIPESFRDDRHGRTSLRGNGAVLERLTRYERIQQYPEDKELLEDVIIENKQAIEMTQVYREIINGTRELLSTVINNRLNNVMKVLTSVTIVMAIPTVISGLYGMNVNADGMPLANLVGGFGMICLLITVICLIAAIILRKRNML
ncbi:MAG: magnesium transporter CorA family protein, partial [Firmicutes bacterium]|nr:magnesium transporter CorA family protein [Bacillota bacterium]